MKKFLIFLVVSLLFVSICSTQVLASAAGTTYDTESNVSTADKITGKGTQIVNAILWFGYAIALGMVVFIGIKYMLGSAESKSNMKSAIVSWFIGAFMVFMCTTLVNLVLNAVTVEDGENSLADSIIKAVDANGNATGK